MNVALILVSLGIANAPEPISHPLVVSYFEDMTSCVAAANQAKLPVAGTLGRSQRNQSFARHATHSPIAGPQSRSLTRWCLLTARIRRSRRCRQELPPMRPCASSAGKKSEEEFVN
jgi:hypothetical protein